MGCGNSKNIVQQDLDDTRNQSLDSTAQDLCQTEVNQQLSSVSVEQSPIKNKDFKKTKNNATTDNQILRPLSSSWDEDQRLILSSGHRKITFIGSSNIPLIRLDKDDLNYQFVSKLFENSKKECLEQGLKDFEKVKIEKICLVNNNHHQNQFEREIYLLSQRQSNEAFAPKSRKEDEKKDKLRKKVSEYFKEKTKEYSNDKLNFMPIWHGTKKEYLESILKAGFANLATTDSGYYGKGIYGTTSAEYAKRVYCGGYANESGILLLNWVGIHSAFMVAGIEDIDLLKGKANHENYDAHFIPVIPRNKYSHKLGEEDIYFPLQLESDDPVYDEIVVFGRQILARYVVYTKYEQLSPDKDLKLKQGIATIGYQETANRSRAEILDLIKENPWIAIYYAILSRTLKNNEIIDLPAKAEKEVISRLPLNLLQENKVVQKYDSIQLCQIALYLDQKCFIAYYNLAEAIKKKLNPNRKVFLAFPIDKYFTYQELYQVVLEFYEQPSDLSGLIDSLGISRSKCLAKLAQSTLDSSIAKEKALEAIKEEPSNSLGWVALGSILSANESILIPQEGDSKNLVNFNAKEIFKKVLEVDRKSIEALLGLAKVLLVNEESITIGDEILNSEDLLVEALKLNPPDLELINELFNLYNNIKKELFYPEIKKLFLDALMNIWQDYKDCSKLWEIFSYLHDEDLPLKLGEEEYTSEQLIKKAFLLDPTNQKLYEKLKILGNLNFDLLAQKIKGNYEATLKKIQEELDLYIPVKGVKIDPYCERFGEEQSIEIENCITEPGIKRFWIQGNKGAGKTLFGRHLERLFWAKYKEGNEIPLFIAGIGKDMSLDNLLTEQGFTKEEIATFNTKINKLILIVDDYEGDGKDLSIYQDNKLILLSQKDPSEGRFDCYYIRPFSTQQIDKYLSNYLKNSKHNKICHWSIDQYYYALDYFHVRDLCQDPFLLRLILQILPEILTFEKNDNKQIESINNKIGIERLTRTRVYKEFIKAWIESKLKSSRHYKKYKDFVVDIKKKVMDFSKDLAWELLSDKQNQLKWNGEDNLNPSLKRFFESSNKKERRILKICNYVAPIEFKVRDIERSTYICSFVHPSFRDYFVMKKIVKDLKEFSNYEEKEVFNYSILEEKNLRYFLVEQIQRKPILRKKCIEIINLSKVSNRWLIAASNAITILNQAGTSFANLDFSGIKIPNADLSGANLDHTKLSGADLTNVKLKGAWLYNAKLNESNMTEVCFGEMSYHKMEQEAYYRHCMYSKKHDYFIRAKQKAVGICRFDINTNSMEKFEELESEDIHHVFSMAVSSDFKWLAVGSNDNLKIWDLGNKSRVKTLPKEEVPYNHTNSLVFSDDNKYLASGGYGKIVYIWDIFDNFKIFSKIIVTDTIDTLAFFRKDSDLLLAVGIGSILYRTTRLNNPEESTQKSIQTRVDIKSESIIGKHRKGKVNFIVGSNHEWLASCGDAIYLWDLQDSRQDSRKNKILEGHCSSNNEDLNSVNSVAFSEDHNILASGSNDKTIRLWSLISFSCIRILNGHTDCVYNVAFTMDNKWLTSISKDGTIRIWDLKNRSYDIISNSYDNSEFYHNNYVYSVAFSADEEWLASGSRDNTVRISRVKYFKDKEEFDFNRALVLDDPKNFVYSVMFSYNNKWLAVGCNDGLYIYKTKFFMNLEYRVNLEQGKGLVKYFKDLGTRSVAFSSNNQSLVIGNDNGEVRLFDLQDLKEDKVLYEHNSKVYSVAFSYDGNWLASGGMDNKVVIWDLHQGINCLDSPFKIFDNHSSCVDGLSFSLDNKWLGSASWDKKVCIYDLKKLDEPTVQELLGHSKEVNTLTFSSDSRYLFSGDYGGFMFVWYLSEGDIWKERFKIDVGFNIFSISYSKNLNLIATGGSDNSVRVWLHEKDTLQLLKTTRQNVLCAQGLDIIDSELSIKNKQLLEQRGAILFSNSSEIKKHEKEKEQPEVTVSDLDSRARLVNI